MNNSIKKSDKARANILNRLKGACENNSGSTPERSRSADVFPQPANILSTFLDEFKKVNGEAIVCEDEEQVSSRLQQLIKERNWHNIICRDEALLSSLGLVEQIGDSGKFEDLEVSITACECLVARSGTIMVSSAHKSGRLLNVFPPIHVVIAQEEQLVPFLDDAMDKFTNRYSIDLPSQATFITGPSRTADIEKTLVMGAHGPKELILIILKK